MSMSRLLAVVAGLGLGGLSVAQDGSKQDSHGLRGTWTVVRVIDEQGKREVIAEDDPRHFTFEFTADRLTTRLKSGSLERGYKLDPTRSPGEIDVVRQAKGKEVLFLGIYTLQDDRLEVCLAGTGNGRPTAFQHGEGIEFAVELQRIKPRVDQAEVVASIKKLGGMVEIDEQRPGKPVVKVDLHETKITDADLELLGSLPELRTLDLRRTSITDAGVARLRGLKQLRLINLFRTQITNDGLVHLSGNKDLETLLVGGTKITDEGATHLRAFAKLKKLSVFDTQIGDASLPNLAGLPDLEILLIEKSKVTDQGAQTIQKALPKLRFKESIG